MTLTESSSPLGPPWQRPLAGRLDELVVDSTVLAGNPLGDPATRPLYVYATPRAASGEATDLTSVYLLQGFTNHLGMWHGRKAFEPSALERIDAAFAVEDAPDAIIVFVDAWTALGGSQFVNSPATGRYMDYLCDEVVPFVDARYPTAATRERRAVSGHSSGGYGALVSAMLRPDTFGAFAAHAPDTLFEIFIHDFVAIARTLRDRFDGSIEALIAAARESDPFDWRTFGTAVSIYAYAAAYSAEPDGRVTMPFELETGRLIPSVWERWLAMDPVRMAAGHADALRSMRHIHLEAGRRDDYLLDVGTQAFAHELTRLGVAHTFELFDGGHSGISYRYPGAIQKLATALQP